MALSWLRRLAARVRPGKAAAPADPLAAWDGLIEDLERQGAQVRRSAATLLTLRAQLERDRARYDAQLESLRARKAQAAEATDAKALRALDRDEAQARRMLEATAQAWAQAQADAEVLKEVAEELGVRLAELQAERAGARARLASGQVVSAAMRQQTGRLDRALALDAARDEVERAHQLAQIYREERARE